MSDMTTHERICRTCQGSGETVHPDDKYMHPANPEQRTVICADCNGDGYVSTVRQ